jgi:hypothetical protein
MRWWPLAAVLAWALAAAVPAQETGRPLPRPAAADAEAEAVGGDGDTLGEVDLDELVAPVALYPDSLLAQVLVAATYPLDIVKADRFLDENAGLADKERADAAEAEDWDESVRVLAGGFPTVVQRMADDIDWTEQLGDAVLAQPDDVLDAVQRMRARAAASGNLESNEAQVVETEGDNISIAPADPGVVYVPQYDTTAAFAPGPYPAPTYGTSTSDLLVTGAIAFGSALLIDEIFDDDDDWDDYWYGPPRVDWDDDEFYPRRDVDFDDINVDRDINIDRSRDRVRIGGDDRGGIDRAWKPTQEQREQAQQRIAARERPGTAGARAATDARVRARGADSGGQAQLQAAAARRQAAGKPPVAQSALKPHPAGKPRVDAAANRGARSIEKSRLPSASTARAAPSRSPTAHRAGTSRPTVHRPTTARPAAHKSPSRSSAFQRSSSGSRAHAASRRGGHSMGGRGGRGGGGRGRR